MTLERDIHNLRRSGHLPGEAVMHQYYRLREHKRDNLSPFPHSSNEDVFLNFSPISPPTTRRSAHVPPNRCTRSRPKIDIPRSSAMILHHLHPGSTRSASEATSMANTCRPLVPSGPTRTSTSSPSTYTTRLTSFRTCSRHSSALQLSWATTMCTCRYTKTVRRTRRKPFSEYSTRCAGASASG